MLRFLAGRCSDAGEAEDLLQDLWIKASGQPAGPIANGRAYLFRMANNLVLDRRRAQQRAMRRDHAWLEDAVGNVTLPGDRPDPAPQADEELARRQEAELLRQAIESLPPGARRALQLHRLEGHPQGEVAQIMGISRSGVEKHLALAMKHLKKSLVACGFVWTATSDEQGLGSGFDSHSEPRR